MGFGYWLIGKLFLFILGAIWCKEVIERFRSDVTEFREAKATGDRAAIGVIWLLTLGIMILMSIFVVSTLVVIIKEM